MLPDLWAAIQALAAGGGLLVLIYQLYQLQRSLLGATEDRLYAQYTEICKLFVENPGLRPYFYRFDADSGDPVVPEETDKLGESPAKVAFMCEMILALVEHAVLQQKNMHQDGWENCWRPYTIERLQQSKALRKFFNRNSHWYSNQMYEEMKLIQPAVEAKQTRQKDPVFSD